MAPSFIQVSLGLAAVLFASSTARAESHTVTFDNKCGKGTPQLILGGQVVSTGQPFTSSGVISGIAYLQTGECNFNGEGCTLLEMTLGNSNCEGCGSSADISLIPPHAFNVEASFSYYGACDGQGATCNSPTCNTAFFVPDDNQVQVQCEADNVNMLITFCGDATQNPVTSAAPSPSKAPVPSSSKVPLSSSKAVVVPPSTPAPSPSSPAIESATPSSSAVSSAPSASPTVDRSSCRSKKRAEKAKRAESESRALYNLHHRRHAAPHANSL